MVALRQSASPATAGHCSFLPNKLSLPKKKRLARLKATPHHFARRSRCPKGKDAKGNGDPKNHKSVQSVPLVAEALSRKWPKCSICTAPNLPKSS
jgi:hypothetical protein